MDRFGTVEEEDIFLLLFLLVLFHLLQFVFTHAIPLIRHRISVYAIKKVNKWEQY